MARLRSAGCVFAEDEAALLLGTGCDGAELEALVLRRVSGEPLETVLGWVEFAGRRLTVARGVFIPRRRTELLARMASDHCGPDSVVLELCCGVGPVAATVEVGEIHLSDLDPSALLCARINVPHGHVHLSDLYADLPAHLRGRVDVLAANAPYVPTGRIVLMPPEARDHESQLALDGGIQGVDLHRRIAAGAPEWLAAGGVLLIETSQTQAPLTERVMRDAGLTTEVVTDDPVDGCVVAGTVGTGLRSGGRA